MAVFKRRRHARSALIATLCCSALALAVSGASNADTPVVNNHLNFATAPYPDSQCGVVDGTSVTRIVEQYRQDASGASIDNVNATTVFTAAATGRTLTVQESNVGRTGAPVYSSDGSYSILFQGAGLGPKFILPDGQVIIDAGTAGFLITFDPSGNFDTFQFLYGHGPSPAACDAIIAALT